MSPREALLMIPGFAHARILAKLASGVAGESWQVESGGGQFVLRIDTPEAAALGLDREAEARVQAVVARAGLTPPLEFLDAERGVSLRAHVPGRAWTDADLRDPDHLDRLGQLLHRLHTLPPAGALYEPGAAARRYARQIGTAEARALADQANVLLADLRDEPFRECLCHNDLVADNLLDDGERVIPIDWEYGGIGDAAFDLAVIVAHHGLPPEAADRLLSAYHGREPTPAERARVDAWCSFYRVLLALWQMRVGESPGS